jgi:hypothetical protein
MEILITVGELLDRSLWTQACQIVGINEWAINEGQMSRDEQIRLTEDQAAQLDLTPRRTEPETYLTPWGCVHQVGQTTCERCELPADSPAARRLAALNDD